MDFFSLGDKIGYSDFNALVYLLRKFKRLTSDLRLGSNVLESDFGTYSFSGGLTNVGGNYIIESPVTISSSDVLKNCFYSFVFNVVDVNLSGEVNKRRVSATGGTGENGVLEVTLPTDLIESDEVILPEFTLDIVFDPHEYYTPVSSLNFTLTTTYHYITAGEVNTITAKVLDDEDDPVTGILLQFNINGVIETETTDSNGEASITYTGTGNAGLVNVKVGGTGISFYDTDLVVANMSDENIIIGSFSTIGDVVIDWGDGNTDIVNNPRTNTVHTYNDGLSTHNIIFRGVITGIGNSCFENAPLNSIHLTDTISYLDNGCFSKTLLTSISIPDTVTYGDDIFYGCLYLNDYQLYWLEPPKYWNDNDFHHDSYDTYYTIPEGTLDAYIAKGYPSDRLVERGNRLPTVLSLSSDKSTLYTDESVTFTGVLTDDENTPIGNASVKLYNGSTLVDTLTTDSDGEYSKTVSGLSVGSYGFKAVYDGDSTYRSSQSSIVNVTVQNHTYSLSISASPSTTTYGNNVVVSGTLKKDNVAYGSQTVTIYDGDTSLGTATTDSSGNYSKTLTGLTVGSHSIKAVHTQAQSSTASVTITKLSTTTSLSATSSSIVVGDTPQVTGYLKDANNTGITGASVKILLGGSLVDTVTTGTGGAFSYTGSATTTTGILTFKAVYDGDTTHNNSESSNVNISVGDHVYSLSISASPSTATVGTDVVVTGTLLKDSSGYGSQTIIIYDGNTSLGTCTTESDGSYSKTLSGLTVGSHTLKAVHTNVESSTVTVTVEDYPVVLTTQDVSMTYKDGSQFVATVTKNGQPYGVGEQLIFTRDGVEYLRTIDANGQAKMNIYYDVGTYTVTSTFGDLTNTNTITVNKASSTTSLTASSSSILTTDTLTLTGAVTGNSMGGYSVKIYDGATLIDTVSSSSGTYTKTLTGLSVGTHTFKAVFDGDANHNSSESSVVTVTVTAPLTPDTISISGTSIIQTGDSDTITATLLAGSTAVAGETLSYTVKHGSTTIDSGSDTTDSNGQISFNYTGTGIGDVTIEVSYGTSLQETFVIEDCVYYNPNQTATTANISLPSAFEISYKVKRTTSANINAGSSILLTDANHNYYVGQYGSLGQYNGFMIRNKGSTSNLVDKKSTTTQMNVEYALKYEYNNGVHTYSTNGSDIVSDTNSYVPTTVSQFYVDSYNYMHELKIKAL